MKDLMETINASMRSLVRQYGCYEAAGELLGIPKGSISKKMKGELHWSIRDAVYLQSALDNHLITKSLTREMNGKEAKTSKSYEAHISNILKEVGESTSLAVTSKNASNNAELKVELQEAIQALKEFEGSL